MAKGTLYGGDGHNASARRSVAGLEGRNWCRGTVVETSRVLIIEYDEEVLAYVKEVLEAEGITVRMARTAREGIQLAETEHPDLVISTFSLPEPERNRLLDLSRHSTDHTTFPVVFMASEYGPRLHRKWMKAGASGFLKKPFLPEDLVQLVRQLLKKDR